MSIVLKFVYFDYFATFCQALKSRNISYISYLIYHTQKFNIYDVRGTAEKNSGFTVYVDVSTRHSGTILQTRTNQHRRPIDPHKLTVGKQMQHAVLNVPQSIALNEPSLAQFKRGKGVN